MVCGGSVYDSLPFGRAIEEVDLSWKPPVLQRLKSRPGLKSLKSLTTLRSASRRSLRTNRAVNNARRCPPAPPRGTWSVD